MYFLDVIHYDSKDDFTIQLLLNNIVTNVPNVCAGLGKLPLKNNKITTAHYFT